MLTKGSKEYDCVCGKSYNQFPSLSRHKKTCTFVEEKIVQNENTNTNEHNNGVVDTRIIR